MKYKVVEHFTSIQGEGAQMGTPATFIRLQGCNLSCDFCDEPKHKNKKLVKELTKRQILALCDAYLVVITGGEPSLNNINPLIQFLQKNGHAVAVESNGYSFNNIKTANLKTLCPKFGHEVDFEAGWDEIKILVDRSMPKQFIKEQIEHWAKLNIGVYLQPINYKSGINKSNMQYVVELCIEFGVPLSPQLHKLLEVE